MPPCPSPTPQSLLKLMSIELMMPSNHLILCRPLLLLPSIFPSIRVFSNESALYIRWPRYWSFSYSIRPPNEYSGLISFRMDWLDLLAVQGTLKSLLQHHSSKASLTCSLMIFHLPSLLNYHSFCYSYIHGTELGLKFLLVILVYLFSTKYVSAHKSIQKDTLGTQLLCYCLNFLTVIITIQNILLLLFYFLLLFTCI